MATRVHMHAGWGLFWRQRHNQTIRSQSPQHPNRAQPHITVRKDKPIPSPHSSLAAQQQAWGPPSDPEQSLRKKNVKRATTAKAGFGQSTCWPPLWWQRGVLQQFVLPVKLCVSEWAPRPAFFCWDAGLIPPTKVTSPFLLLLTILTLVNIWGSSDKQEIPLLIDCPNIFNKSQISVESSGNGQDGAIHSLGAVWQQGPGNGLSLTRQREKSHNIFPLEIHPISTCTCFGSPLMTAGIMGRKWRASEPRKAL